MKIEKITTYFLYFRMVRSNMYRYTLAGKRK
jgi:hypothetical protein